MKQNILFAKIKVMNKKEVKIIDAVIKENDKIYKSMPIIEVIESKIIGKTNVSKEYTEVKRNNETRNKITGTYE
jgi:hypothetical protein